MFVAYDVIYIARELNMKCPVCENSNLLMSERQGIEIDYCPQADNTRAHSRKAS